MFAAGTAMTPPVIVLAFDAVGAEAPIGAVAHAGWAVVAAWHWTTWPAELKSSKTALSAVTVIGYPPPLAPLVGFEVRLASSVNPTSSSPMRLLAPGVVLPTS